jgi:hypothetical protein
VKKLVKKARERLDVKRNTVLMKTGLVVENQNFLNNRTAIANVHFITTKGRYTRRQQSQLGKVNRFAVFDNVWTLMACE